MLGSLAGKSADAATVSIYQAAHAVAHDWLWLTQLHIYCGWDVNKNSSTEENIKDHLAVAASRSTRFTV